MNTRFDTCRRYLAALVTVLALAAPAARALAAEPADEKTAQAKALSQEANAMYAVGDFAQAADKYQAAYKLKPDAALLYNAAQSYRMAGNNEKAVLLYKNYVMFYPNARNRSNVDLQISKLQEAIAAQHKAQTQPPTTTEPTTGNPTGVPGWGASPTGASSGSLPGGEAGGAAPATTSSTSSPASSSVGTAAVTTAPNPDSSSSAGSAPGATLTQTAPAPTSDDTPIYKKWWLWTAVGVAAGGVVAVVLLSGGSSKAWSTAPDFGPGAKETSR
jgi:tetratricopeptide (TPR) repeat protein